MTKTSSFNLFSLLLSIKGFSFQSFCDLSLALGQQANEVFKVQEKQDYEFKHSSDPENLHSGCKYIYIDIVAVGRDLWIHDVPIVGKRHKFQVI